LSFLSKGSIIGQSMFLIFGVFLNYLEYFTDLNLQSKLDAFCALQHSGTSHVDS
jgi:hypothetical protein